MDNIVSTMFNPEITLPQILHFCNKRHSFLLEAGVFPNPINIEGLSTQYAISPFETSNVSCYVIYIPTSLASSSTPIFKLLQSK